MEEENQNPNTEENISNKEKLVPRHHANITDEDLPLAHCAK